MKAPPSGSNGGGRDPHGTRRPPRKQRQPSRAATTRDHHVPKHARGGCHDVPGRKGGDQTEPWGESDRQTTGRPGSRPAPRAATCRRRRSRREPPAWPGGRDPSATSRCARSPGRRPNGSRPAAIAPSLSAKNSEGRCIVRLRVRRGRSQLKIQVCRHPWCPAAHPRAPLVNWRARVEAEPASLRLTPKACEVVRLRIVVGCSCVRRGAAALSPCGATTHARRPSLQASSRHAQTSLGPLYSCNPERDSLTSGMNKKKYTADTWASKARTHGLLPITTALFGWRASR